MDYIECKAVNSGRAVVLAGIGEVPVAGQIISGLVGVFWEEAEEEVVDPWEQIKVKTEALINQKLNDVMKQRVKEDLEGLKNVLDDYRGAVEILKKHKDIEGDKEHVRIEYDAALLFFRDMLPHFQSKDNEVLLLPLFAQMANLHLALLQDGVNWGANWDKTPELVDDLKTKLKASIKSYEDWVTKWYRKGQEKLAGQVEARYKYDCDMTLMVTDISFYWPYFDPEVHSGVDALPTLQRTIYSYPVGPASLMTAFLPQGDHTKRLTAVSIEGRAEEDWVDPRPGFTNARRKFFPGGIDSITTAHGEHLEKPKDIAGNSWWGNISENNPVVEVVGTHNQSVYSIQLKFKDGTATNVCGGWGGRDSNGAEFGQDFSRKFTGHILSEIYMSGDNDNVRKTTLDSNEGRNTMVFGFRYEDSYIAQEAEDKAIEEAAVRERGRNRAHEDRLIADIKDEVMIGGGTADQAKKIGDYLKEIMPKYRDEPERRILQGNIFKELILRGASAREARVRTETITEALEYARRNSKPHYSTIDEWVSSSTINDVLKAINELVVADSPDACVALFFEKLGIPEGIPENISRNQSLHKLSRELGSRAPLIYGMVREMIYEISEDSSLVQEHKEVKEKEAKEAQKKAGKKAVEPEQGKETIAPDPNIKATERDKRVEAAISDLENELMGSGASADEVNRRRQSLKRIMDKGDNPARWRFQESTMNELMAQGATEEEADKRADSTTTLFEQARNNSRLNYLTIEDWMMHATINDILTNLESASAQIAMGSPRYDPTPFYDQLNPGGDRDIATSKKKLAELGPKPEILSKFRTIFHEYPFM